VIGSVLCKPFQQFSSVSAAQQLALMLVALDLISVVLSLVESLTDSHWQLAHNAQSGLARYISDIFEFEIIGYFPYFQNRISSIFFNIILLLDVKTSLKCENRHVKFSILLII